MHLEGCVVESVVLGGVVNPVMLSLRPSLNVKISLNVSFYFIKQINIPSTSTIYDITYTANMAYADFYPSLINERQCLDYAMAVANDEDGYEGIQFCRYIADIIGKDDTIDWNDFI